MRGVTCHIVTRNGSCQTGERYAMLYVMGVTLFIKYSQVHEAILYITMHSNI